MSGRSLLAFCLVVLLAASAPGCIVAGSGQTGAPGGLRAWIDAPRHGSTIPLAPYEVVSHGADPGGISQVELSINGAVHRTDGAPGQTLVTVRQMWMPPGLGNYTLTVRAQAGGGWSDYAVAVVTVASATATPTPSPSRSASPTVTPSRPASPTATATAAPSATATATALLPPTAGIAFTADPDTISPGECSMLRWKVETASLSFLDNTLVEMEGSRRDCPSRTVSHTLRIVMLDGRTAQRTVTVTVRGSAAGQTPADPTPTVAEPGPTDTPVPGATDTPVPPPSSTPPAAASPTSTPVPAQPPTHTPAPPPSATPTPTPTARLILPFQTPVIRVVPTATPTATRRPEIIR